MIYFVSDGDAVKIGYTQDAARLRARLQTLACGNPRELELDALIDQGGPRTEKALHDLLGPWRIRGEWFQRCSALQHALKSAQAGNPPSIVVRDCAQAVERSESYRKRRHGKRLGTEAHGKFAREVARGVGRPKALDSGGRMP